MDKKTPLYDTHVKYGGKIVPFGGFLLPIQYESGIKQEHGSSYSMRSIRCIPHGRNRRKRT